MRGPDISLARAREMRRILNGPELGLWLRLKNRQLGGFKFRRQHPVGPYILDFYCAEAKLAVEIDGDSHGSEGREAHDARRDTWLLEQGIETLRISTELAKDPGAAASLVLAKIRGEL